jgi:hypothetical protein
VTTDTTTFADQLRQLRACGEAIEWAGTRTLAEAWAECPRSDWMLWLLRHGTGWSRDALNRICLDIMAEALEAARPRCEKADYWLKVEAAHRQVREAIEGRGDLVAARMAAAAAPAAAAAAGVGINKRIADIIRKHMPTPPEIQ